MRVGGIFPEVKRQGREAHHSPPNCAEAKKVNLNSRSLIRLNGIDKILKIPSTYLRKIRFCYSKKNVISDPRNITRDFRLQSSCLAVGLYTELHIQGTFPLAVIMQVFSVLETNKPSQVTLRATVSRPVCLVSGTRLGPAANSFLCFFNYF
jgi:hypothetical protein